ncbi:salicylate 1-monooxygenase [Fusarium tjaetaba]|uniref:Salicylate 1-monooxygenase n=1 Tax=Fusarium tjaetaba TaxID=1567544 RepID=A0A8H5QYS1_9HYPO|nr:salicylate 1-monooxygenase [Fusarium tjaetaba]KAF5624806.1 salicylate 1-monooxygenase [Fusarium tjaetaba]
MSKHQKDFQIAIIGGGIAGIVLAISLLKRNIPCKIYERAHAFSDIGAGLGISPNAQDAMKACDPSVHNAFKKVANGNTWESKKKFLFEFLDGVETATTDSPLFHVENRTGLQGCHRGAFANELIKLLPSDVVQFNKELQIIEEGNSGGIRLIFQDGSSEAADAVVGCDGIKSKLRDILVGADHPSSKCSYTHKYAYRGMIPMPQAIEVLGEERALNATISDDWPSERQLVLPVTKEDLLHDFEGFRPSVLKILDNTERLDRWAIFDLGDNPVPTFAKGRVCIIGDAAHASSPHHGAGAGLCIEDAAVLASILAHDRVRVGFDIEAAFSAFDISRRERCQWVVEKSRRAGQLFERQTELGSDFGRIFEELKETLPTIWDYDIGEVIKTASIELDKA